MLTGPGYYWGENSSGDSVAVVDADYFCEAGDDKPTDGVGNGSRLWEMDADNSCVILYLFAATSAAWIPMAKFQVEAGS